MEITALKLRLIRLILEIDTEAILLKVLEILEEFEQNQTPDLSEEQITEIDRRLQELESGEVVLFDAAEFMQELRNEIREKRQKKYEQQA